MKKTIIYFVLLFSLVSFSQEIRLLKGAVTHDLVANDSLSETFSLYVPTYFNVTKEWPVLFVFDLEGKGKNAISVLKNAAEQEGYIVASSNAVQDSLSLSKNVLIASRMIKAVMDLVPISKNRTYTAGFNTGASFASVLPTFIKDLDGVIAIGAPVAHEEILVSSNPFHFVGIVSRFDYNFRVMLETRKVFDRLKFPNQLIVFDSFQNIPDAGTVATAMQMLTLASMSKKEVALDNSKVEAAYKQWFLKANTYVTANEPLLASYLLVDMKRIFQPLRSVDSLKLSQKNLKKSATFKKVNRSQNSYFLKEDFSKNDINFFLNEDVASYNYTNLGWWKYQIEELAKLEKSTILFEKQMAARLKGYINALIEDEIDFIRSATTVDLEALDFLYMLKTITAPKEFEYYLKIISNSCKIEDYGTALFYLEELLKNGFTDKNTLYEVPDTALFRIMPEFNELIEKYLQKARYEIHEDALED